MAIDTAFKRRSSAAARRMPWMRRFGIAPDGTIGQPDRQAAALVYGGITPVAAAEGIQFSLGDMRPQFSLPQLHDEFSEGPDETEFSL